MPGWMQQGRSGRIRRDRRREKESQRVIEEAAMGARERMREQGEEKERETVRCRESQREPKQQRNGGERRLEVD